MALLSGWADAEAHLRAADPVMAALVERVGPCRIERHEGAPFGLLCDAIVSQQLSGKAARTIHGRLVAALGDPLEPAAVAAADPDDMRACGLSRAKARAMKDLAARTLDGRLDLDALATAPEEEAEASLLEVWGIGRWTAEMFLMFGMGRPDVLSPGDVALRRAAKELYGLEGELDEERFATLAEPWRPWRTAACWYLWQAS